MKLSGYERVVYKEASDIFEYLTCCFKSPKCLTRTTNLYYYYVFGFVFGYKSYKWSVGPSMSLLIFTFVRDLWCSTFASDCISLYFGSLGKFWVLFYYIKQSYLHGFCCFWSEYLSDNLFGVGSICVSVLVIYSIYDCWLEKISSVDYCGISWC